MADPGGAPRRVSMAYILGFSKNPYKDPKPPPQPRPPRSSGLDQMMTSPGGIVEWAASDGRKGNWKNENGNAAWKICGELLARPHFQCKDRYKELQGQGGGHNGGNAEATGGSASNNQQQGQGNNKQAKSADDGDGASPHGFTKEQDKKMIEWRTGHSKQNWDDFAKEINKLPKQCADRFREIKPKDWRPADAQDGGGKGNTKKNNKNNRKGNKNEEKPEVNNNGGGTGDWPATIGSNNTSGGNATSGGNDPWNTGNGGGDNSADNNGKVGDDAWNAPATGGDSGENRASNAGDGAGWGGTGGDGANDAAATDWNADSNNQQKNDTSGGDQNAWGGGDTWGAAPAPAKTASKAGTKAHSHHSASHKSSHRHGTQNNTPTLVELEVKPDDVFSADDLRLLARILQQDYQMVWNRVSWRFKDKTGRTIAPEVFEKKITGRVEGKEGKEERRERMRK
ncbi:hypothetical protein BKA63DRAFT_478087 [Paraphoma chrysanthemicola]|nr:hypothetical protein BKA63DRAFT_478087 [Paraphoma chrysanthemicola]